MSIVTVEDIAYVRFGAPDLAKMRDFLIDFGLVDATPVGDGVLRMRAADGRPYVHVTEPGEAGFRGLALRAPSLADLDRLATAEGLALRDLDGPGGGKMVRLTDPNGFEVDVIAAQTMAQPIAGEHRVGWNLFQDYTRRGIAKRLAPGPSPVSRLGHAVLLVEDLEITWTWWRERFGLLLSDEVRAPDGTAVALFIRCDRGETPADHHTLNFASVPGKPAGFHHAAFEVGDLDSLMTGHDHLLARGHRHSWGIGRHFLGSQVFDYWEDPFGHRVEHWTDGDVFPASTPTNVTDLQTMLGRQWGPPAPEGFV